MPTPNPKPGVLKYGIGYDLVVVEERSRLVLGIRCHACDRTSFHPKDVTERYCGACHVFHEDRLGSQQA
jgi:ribosomal protein L37E